VWGDIAGVHRGYEHPERPSKKATGEVAGATSYDLVSSSNDESIEEETK
jgi:hypothetical protein